MVMIILGVAVVLSVLAAIVGGNLMRSWTPNSATDPSKVGRIGACFLVLAALWTAVAIASFTDGGSDTRGSQIALGFAAILVIVFLWPAAIGLLVRSRRLGQ